jgi:hypothetical protein
MPPASSALTIPKGTNFGRQTLFISGINGIAAGGQVQINLPCDRRYHRLIFYATAVNYTGGVASAITKITGSGTGGTAVLTVGTSHQVTAIGTFAGSMSGYTVGDTFSVADATGTGAVFTVSTVSSGAITAATVTVSGTASAISAASFFTQLVQSVGGVNVRDLTPAQEIQRAQINPGFGTSLPNLGEIPIFYTEPWRNFIKWPAITSWDMAGQSSFQLKLTLNTNLLLPNLVGIMEFDFMRNTTQGEIPQPVFNAAPANQRPGLLLAPITAHAFTQQVGIGLNLINILPSNFPVTRLLLSGSSANNLTQIEIDQDGNKVFECYANVGPNAQLNESLQEYGFTTTVFDAMFIADINQRPNQALKFQQPQGGLILRVWSNAVQLLTIIQEKLPGGYAS